MFYLSELERNAVCCELRPGENNCDYLILEELENCEYRFNSGMYAYSAPIALFHYLQKRFPHIMGRHPEVSMDALSILKDLYQNWYRVEIDGFCETFDTDIIVFNDNGAIGYYIYLNGASFRATIY